MQTREYGDLFSLISNMIGAVTLASDEQTQVANFINRRFFEAFQESPVWPRYVVTGEERDIAIYNISGVTDIEPASVNGNYRLIGVSDGGEGNSKEGTNIYVKIENFDKGTLTGSILYQQSGGSFAISGSDSILDYNSVTDKYSIDDLGTLRFTATSSGYDKPEDVISWTAGTGVSGQPRIKAVQMIPYEELNKTTIGDFNRIHRKQPFINNSAIEYDFYADVDGANILNITNTTDSSAFVTYKIPFEKLSPTLSAPPESNDYYNSNLAVPQEFFNYIAHAVYADFLRVQNKQQEAIAEEGVAKNYLAQELEKVDLRMNNSTINNKFSTYVNRQSR